MPKINDRVEAFAYPGEVRKGKIVGVDETHVTIVCDNGDKICVPKVLIWKIVNDDGTKVGEER